MAFCFWSHRLPDTIVHETVQNLDCVIVYADFRGILCMYIGWVPCATCGKPLDVYRVAYIAAGKRANAGTWQRAARRHVRIFFECKKRTNTGHTQEP